MTSKRKELCEIEEIVRKRVSFLIYEQYNFNISAFARNMGFTPAQCNAWIKGMCAIPLKKLYQIYKKHEKPLGYYFGEDDENSNNTKC